MNSKKKPMSLEEAQADAGQPKNPDMPVVQQQDNLMTAEMRVASDPHAAAIIRRRLESRLTGTAKAILGKLTDDELLRHWNQSRQHHRERAAAARRRRRERVVIIGD